MKLLEKLVKMDVANLYSMVECKTCLLMEYSVV